MLISFVNLEKAITETDLDSLEVFLGGNIPLELRQLYLKHNGGYIDIERKENSLLLAGFVPVKYGRLPIELAYKELLEDFPWMKGKVPFAFDEGGNYFLFSISGERRGEVGLWIMDTEEYHVVAEDFSEFSYRLNK